MRGDIAARVNRSEHVLVHTNVNQPSPHLLTASPSSAQRTHRKPSAAPLLVAALIGALGACTGQINGSSAEASGPASGAGSSSSSSGTGAGGGGGSAAPDPQTVAVACADADVKPDSAPLRRLSNSEYVNSITALFPKLALPDFSELPPEAQVDGFDNNVKTQTPSPVLVAQYQKIAHAVGQAASANLAQVLPCSPASAADEPACAQQFAADLVRRAYRRPLTPSETQTFADFVTTARSDNDFPTAIGMLIEAVLQSPHFLYRPEFGAGAVSSGALALSAYELATRLSYFLWEAPPDTALTAAADSGALDQPEELQRQVDRLLADPRAHVAVQNFHEQWLNLGKFDAIDRDRTLYPAFGDATRASMKASTLRFLEHTFWESDAKLSTLLTDTHAYVDGTLAPIYGVAAPPGADLVYTALDPSQRSGLLTQAGFMAAFAHNRTSAPILRGVFVMDRLLCTPPKPPPKTVNTTLAETTDPNAPQTTRMRVEGHVQPACAGCHQAIDGLGFGFENYDAIGAFRTTENGLPVDATGTVTSTGEIDGNFNGAVELSQKLAQSDVVRSCLATEWFRHGFGRTETDDDSCTVRGLTAQLKTSGGDMRLLMKSIALSPSFRHRTPIVPAGAN